MTFILNITTSLRSDHVIVTSLENDVITYHLRTKDTKKVLANNFRNLKRIVIIFAKQHQRIKEKLTVQRKSTSTN